MPLRNLSQFLQKDIWRIRVKKLSRRKHFFITYLRVIVLAVREFQSNQCQLNASALSFYILLSIVPLVAMAFGIAKGFGLDQIFQTQLLMKFPGQEQGIIHIIGFANNLLKDTHGGVIAGVSVIILFWTVIQVLNNIEGSFNDIWGIKKSRSLGRKISDYLSMVFIGPFFIILSGTATVFLNTQLQLIIKDFSFLGFLGSSILLFFNALPYAVIWVFFTFIYMFMPNTKVKFSSAFIGGFIAGTIYQVLQIVYIQFQVKVGTMNAVYGGFAALPLFLLWLQLSLRVLLFGAEISFAHQNLATYEFEQDCLNVSHAFKRLLSLYVAALSIKRFNEGQLPLTAPEISDLTEIPMRLVQDILFELTEAGILSETAGFAEKQLCYQPARDINQLTVHVVSDLLDQRGCADVPVENTPELSKLQETLHAFSGLLKRAPENRLLKDI